jgi:hypothetical protein
MRIARHAARLVPGKVKEIQVPPGTADRWATQTQGGEPVWRGEPPATGAEILFSGEMLISGFSRSDKDKKVPAATGAL